MKNLKTFSIGYVSKVTGCHIETIRYYERIGILPVALRSSGGHRCYLAGDMERLRFVVRARELGFSIKDIRELLSLSEKSDSCDHIRQIALAHVGEINQKIKDLQRLTGVLQVAAEKCEDNQAMCCPVIDVLSNVHV